ncbi:GIY-YIG nuclease family protein [Porticoccus sp. W117]|uniref:GIY-YIG nuclease family protein n=1 Tax=Porticoccus sp. W117 TaxID=3054777 RepID=UPI0025933D30|nr:GIY-YIG nuclease family protein [Porticoccus sp. W117]MDM3872137.1 GIY-YIG nuclease family protein [Porticoccus sp. W117]
MTNWHLYLIRTANGALYTGISTDVARRFQEHSSGKGARALRGKGPLQLVYQQLVGSHSQALKLEAAVKRLKKIQKEQLVAGAFPCTDLLQEVCDEG